MGHMKHCWNIFLDELLWDFWKKSERELSEYPGMKLCGLSAKIPAGISERSLRVTREEIGERIFVGFLQEIQSLGKFSEHY